MHADAMRLMAAHLTRAQWPSARALDVGSLNVNGTFRELVERRGWTYTGLDLEPGDNVDVVAPGAYDYPFPDGTFDVVLSGNTLEHVEWPWEWVVELGRVLRPGGLLALVAPHTFEEHRFPVDCWRVLPDGMRVLLGIAGMVDCRVEKAATDTAGSGFKRLKVGG